MKRLYIIGNGFDIYHGIRSSLSDFRSFVEARDSSVWDACENFLPADEKWSDLEAALGMIDTDYILEQHEHFLVSYGATDWGDSCNHDYEWAVNQISENLSTKLLYLLTKWVSRLKIPNRNEFDEILTIKKDSLFLSFNYTETLMKIYNVDRNNIFFPHGFIGDPKTDLVLGHAWVPSKKMVEFADENTDIRVVGAWDILDKYFELTFKPSSAIINDNLEYFNLLNAVEEVFVLGHSLGQVDHPYLFKIISSITSHAFWKISYFGDPEPINQELERLGIGQSNYCLVTLSEL
jgi:hypothetical protein